jgi:peptide chain release factor subunit 1
MRFNRLRKGAVRSFLSEVAEDVRESCLRHKTRGIVIAGPGDAKKEFREILPPEMGKKVLAVVDLPIDAPRKEIVEVGDEIAIADERARSEERARGAAGGILKGGPGSGASRRQGRPNSGKSGPGPSEGRIDAGLDLREVPGPGGGGGRPPEACPNCGGPTSAVDVVEELYELALRTGAEVEFVEEDSCLASGEGVGALLRY